VQRYVPQVLLRLHVKDEYIPDPQVHELGHSLDLLTSWDPFWGSSEKSAGKFGACFAGHVH